jgi:hypothetical protein
MIKEKEKEKESARETTIPNEGINRQIQSQRAVFSWSTKAGDPLVVFSGHEFHLKLLHFLQKRKEERRIHSPHQKNVCPPQNKKE